MLVKWSEENLFEGLEGRENRITIKERRREISVVLVPVLLFPALRSPSLPSLAGIPVSYGE